LYRHWGSVQAVRHIGGDRGIALLFHNHGTRREWGVSVTPRPLFTHGKDPVLFVQEAGRTPGPAWTGAEILAPHRDSIPDLQPVASRYTDYATRPTKKSVVLVNYCVYSTRRTISVAEVTLFIVVTYVGMFNRHRRKQHYQYWNKYFLRRLQWLPKKSNKQARHPISVCHDQSVCSGRFPPRDSRRYGMFWLWRYHTTSGLIQCHTINTLHFRTHSSWFLFVT